MKLRGMHVLLMLGALIGGFVGCKGLENASPAQKLADANAVIIMDGSEAQQLPMFGGKEKSQKERLADQAFIDAVVAQAGSPEAGSRQIVRIGWANFHRQDFDGAMIRFNQAWLLDPGNAQVYWGFGALLQQQGRVDKALEMIEKSFQLDPGNVNLMGDLAFAYACKARGIRDHELREAFYQSAFDLIERADAKSPRKARIQAQWAMLHYLHGQYAKAWLKIHEARGYGQIEFDPVFIEALDKKMPDPYSDEPTTKTRLKASR